MEEMELMGKAPRQLGGSDCAVRLGVTELVFCFSTLSPRLPSASSAWLEGRCSDCSALECSFLVPTLL